MADGCKNCGRYCEQSSVPASAIEDIGLLFGLTWCSIGCALRYAKDELTPLEYAELRTTLSDRLGGPVRECPPLSSLRNRGGTLTLREYHNGAEIAHSPVQVIRRRPANYLYNTT